MPKEDFYDGFKQLEDGVGVIRIFRNNIKDNVNKLSTKAKGSFSLITGQSAYKEVIEASKMINNHSNDIDIEVIKIDNNFLERPLL